MNNENNKMQVDIDTLFKQNVNDLSSIKELYSKLKDMENKILQIKNIDSQLAIKLKKDYENLKKIILDENVQAKLANDIETINLQLDTKTSKVEMNNKLLNSRKFKPKFGFAPWWVSGTKRTYIDTTLNNFVKYGAEEFPIIVHVNYNVDTQTFYTEENISDMVYAVEKGKSLGLNVSMIKFHTYFDESKYLISNFEKFKLYWKSELKLWSETFKNYGIKNFTVLNEVPILYNDSSYDSFVVECLQIPKSKGYKVGVSTAGITQTLKLSQTIHNNVDCYYCNIYPVISYNLSSATYEESINAWNDSKIVIKELKKYNKPIYMSETGCQDRWSALSSPERYDWAEYEPNFTGGYASSLFLYGLFNSEIGNYIQGVTYWYFDSLYNDLCKNMILDYTGR